MLKMVGKEIANYTMNPSRNQAGEVASALITKYPYLVDHFDKENGINRWIYRILTKMQRMRAKLAKAGEPSAVV